MINNDEVKKNINAFLKKYGIKGFLILYFSKYLLKLLKFQLKSRISDVEFPTNDPGYIFYTENGKISSFSDIEKYENELYTICKQKAEIIVNELEKSGEFSLLFAGDFSKINDSVLEKKFEKELHQTLEKMSKETKNGN